MQKLWTICLSLMMGISFVASYPAALVEAPAMKTPDESLEAIKAKAFMDPIVSRRFQYLYPAAGDCAAVFL